MNAGIPQTQLDQIKSLFAENQNIDEVLLFGSRAKGTQREGSDIDLAIKGKKINFTELTKIEMAYEKLYLPWKLNLVIYTTITNQELKDHIDRMGLCIYSKRMR